jgi:hypothetical protein
MAPARLGYLEAKSTVQKKKLNLAAAEVAGNGEPVQKEEEVIGHDDLTISSRQRLGARFFPGLQNFVMTKRLH